MNTRPTLALEHYAGSYADSLYGKGTIRVEAGKLVLQLGGQVGDLEHWQDDVFRVNWRQPLNEPDYLAFVLDAHGKVGELRVGTGPMRFRRARSPETP